MATTELEIESTGSATPAWREARARAEVGPHLGDGWIAYRRGLGLRPHYLLLRGAGGEIDSVGVVWLARPRFRPWLRPAAAVDVLPAQLHGDGDARAATDRAATLLRLARRRWRSLTIESFGGPSPPPDLAAVGFAARERLEFTVDLRPDDDQRWSAVKQSHRRKVRKATQAGVEVDLRDDAAAELASLQASTSDRRAARGEDMQSLSEGRFRALCDHLRADGGSGLVVVGRVGGEPVSAMLIAIHARRAYYLMGGTNAAGLEANAASLVFWEAMRALHARGVARLNLGGVPANAADPDSAAHGLYRFKLGWGATPAACRSGLWRRP